MPPKMVRERIRVLHLGSPSGVYGAERWILALVRYLDPTQTWSVVGTIKDAPGPEPELCRQAQEMGIPTCVVEAHGRFNVRAIAQLVNYIHRHHIEILHTHGYKGDVLGLCAARLSGCSVLSTPHGWSTKAGVMLQLYEALDRFVLGLLDAVIPLSEDLYCGLSRRWWRPRRLYLIQNGVDLAEVDQVLESWPENIGRGAGGFRIGYVGQLIPRKGVDVLIRAFSRLGMPNGELWIVGEGPERRSLERLALELGQSERVRFLGYRSDRIALLKTFDVFVLPSLLEGIPRCVLEAMATGVPVIASDIPGSRTVVEHRITGLLFPPGDVERLTERLQAVHRDERLRTSLAEKARSLVRSRFSAEAMACRYLELYRALTGRSSGGASTTEVEGVR
jgi:glycosyltransferase involved in cell wall biosynthesis